MTLNEALNTLRKNGYKVNHKINEAFNPKDSDELMDILVGLYDFDVSTISSYFDFFPEQVNSVISGKMDFQAFLSKIENWCGVNK